MCSRRSPCSSRGLRKLEKHAVSAAALDFGASRFGHGQNIGAPLRDVLEGMSGSTEIVSKRGKVISKRRKAARDEFPPSLHQLMLITFIFRLCSETTIQDREQGAAVDWSRGTQVCHVLHCFFLPLLILYSFPPSLSLPFPCLVGAIPTI